eukprot:6196373-Pleurochrysis_carterae.AAC.1
MGVHTPLAARTVPAVNRRLAASTALAGRTAPVANMGPVACTRLVAGTVRAARMAGAGSYPDVGTARAVQPHHRPSSPHVGIRERRETAACADLVHTVRTPAASNR